MRSFESKFHGTDVVAAFENQTDAEAVVAQLRQVGFRKRDIGYFAWHPLGGLKNLLDRDYARECAAVGGFIGIVVGIWSAPMISDRLISVHSIPRFVELTLLCALGACLLFGFIGWDAGARIHENAVKAPVIDPAAGPFILTVSAGEDREWVWSVIRRHNGYKPSHAVAAHPAAI